MNLKAAIILSSLFLITQANATQAIIEGERAHPVVAKNGLVVTSHELATTAALEILKQGGNAIDAAVTAGFVLAVVQPRSGNIGGGGFMLISPNKGEVIAIDYRETAPEKATEKMFQDAQGNVEPNRSRLTHQAAGVPGTPAGLLFALEQYGTLPRKTVLAPAIKLAEKGFIVTERLSNGIKQKSDLLTTWPATKEIFFNPDGTPLQAGQRLKQSDLTKTLKRIEKHGAKGFYEGKTAQLIATDMKNNNGLISLADLKNYHPKVRKPINGNYRGYEVYSMSPPSSGGIHIIQILNMLEPYPLGDFGHNSAKTIHIMTEAMKRAYADRAEYLGDPDFIDIPVTQLISKSYAQKRRATFNLKQATPSNVIKHGVPIPSESNETTHFSIIDKAGNAVSNTYTINFSFGSGIIVPGTGFLLNNEMDDFSAKPGVPNAYGLIGNTANKVEPQKRMLSSMSPTILKKDGENAMILGSPGGSRIITTVLQVILNVIDHNLNIQSAVNAARVHHQWYPDMLRIEQGISVDTITLLKHKGHTIDLKPAMGAVQAIQIKDKNYLGATDPRRSTGLAAGY